MKTTKTPAPAKEPNPAPTVKSTDNRIERLGAYAHPPKKKGKSK